MPGDNNNGGGLFGGNEGTPSTAPEPYVATNATADNGKGTKTVGNVTSSPWGPLQQPVLDFVKNAMGQYSATGGAGGNISPYTTQGIASIANAAKAGVPGLGAGLDAVNGVITGQDGITTGAGFGNIASQAGQPTSSSQLGGLVQNGAGLTSGMATSVAQNGIRPATVSTEDQLQGLLSGLGGGSANNLAATARGDYLNNGDPYLETLIADSTRKTTDALKDSYSAAGRYGGATMNRDLVDRVYAGEAGTRYANYQAERDRQTNAALGLEGAQQGRAGLGQSMLGQIASGRQQDVANRFSDTSMRLGAENQLNNDRLANTGVRMNAAGQMDQMRQNSLATVLAALGGQTGVQGQNIANQMGAAELLPMLNALGYSGGQALIGAGEAQQGLPYSNINQIASLLLGSAGLGGNSTETAPKTPGKDFLSALFGGLGAVGSIVSDERMKKDIRRVGKTDGGLPIYVYRYKGEDDDAPVHMGVMAQEAREVFPDAVVELPGGVLAVNYSKVA